MAYNEKLAERLEKVFAGKRGITQKKMFGGLAFLHYGNMCCGVVKDQLMVRVGPYQYDKALKLKHTTPMDFTGRPMKGMIYVKPTGLKTAPALRKWIEMGLAFTKTLGRK